jgi:hypothetical protein
MGMGTRVVGYDELWGPNTDPQTPPRWQHRARGELDYAAIQVGDWIQAQWFGDTALSAGHSGRWALVVERKRTRMRVRFADQDERLIGRRHVGATLRGDLAPFLALKESARHLRSLLRSLGYDVDGLTHQIEVRTDATGRILPAYEEQT